ncbi:MAG: DUF2723 domain-containing protein [bacterium]|nr:DUF2723 domain-containing protein [bacterium]
MKRGEPSLGKILIGLFLTFFLLYSYLTIPTVYGGDSGDFLSAIAVTGVAHPSGYPLYVLIGFVLKALPVSAPLAWKVGIGSAFFSALAIVFEYLIAYRIWKNKAYALLVSLTLAFTFPFWLYAEHSEVFALHHFFITVIFFWALVYRQTKNVRFLYLCAFFSGLSLTNNESIILLFPGIFLLVITDLLRSGRVIRSVIISFLCLLVGLLPYAYIPWAAAKHPPVNWNDAETLDTFLWLVLRRDFGWTPTSVIGPFTRVLALKQYASYLFSELQLLAFLTVVVGVISAWFTKKDKITILAITLSFILFGPFFFYYGALPSYDIFSMGVREKFIASSLILLLLFLPFGIERLLLFVRSVLRNVGVQKKRLQYYSYFFICFFFLIPVLLVTRNLPVLDLRSVRITEVTTTEILQSLPNNNVLIAKHDNILFPGWYLIYGTRLRSDSFVVTARGLTDLAKRGRLHLIKPVQIRPENIDSEADSVAYSLTAPVFISETDYHTIVFDGKILLYPYGMVWKYAKEPSDQLSKREFLAQQNKRLAALSGPEELISPEQRNRLWLLSNYPLFYSHAYTNTGYFLMYAYHDYELARTYFEKAIQIDDQDHWAYEGLGISYYKQKNFRRARESFLKAVAIQPLNHNAYFLLYGSVVALGDRETKRDMEAFFAKYQFIYTDFRLEKTEVKLP